MAKARQNETGFQWTKDRLKAAQMLADNSKTDVEIADHLGIGRATLARWKERPEFAARVAEIVAETAGALKAKGIAEKQNRINALSERLDRMQELIAARASSMADEIAGGETGLLVAIPMQWGSKYAFDAALLKEMREHEKQAAIELGEWSEKRELTGPNNTPLFSDLFDKLSKVWGNGNGNEGATGAD